jgi:ribosomal protein L37E
MRKNNPNKMMCIKCGSYSGQFDLCAVCHFKRLYPEVLKNISKEKGVTNARLDGLSK